MAAGTDFGDEGSPADHCKRRHQRLRHLDMGFDQSSLRAPVLTMVNLSHVKAIFNIQSLLVFSPNEWSTLLHGRLCTRRSDLAGR